MPSSIAGTESSKVNGVPAKRWRDSTFESFDLKLNPAMQAAYEQCEKVAAGREISALLVGPPGNGKTHLAIAAMHRAEAAYFWKVPDYLDWLRYMRFDRDFDEFSLTRSYRNDGFLLVLDDMGVEKETEWASEQLYKILDSRYDNELPTIITTNTSADKMHPRIQSRYRSGLVVCRGKDLRGKERR
jgi:DNA replication protein DnaC